MVVVLEGYFITNGFVLQPVSTVLVMLLALGCVSTVLVITLVKYRTIKGRVRKKHHTMLT